MLPVAATPYLVMVAEIACTNLVLDRLEPGQITVGTRVVIDHVGASKVGATLTLHIPNSSAVRQTGSNFSFASRMLSGRWRKSSMSALRSHFRKS
jgi:predicted thioesterase